MKKTLFLFVALVSMSASMFADGLTATLQQGDKMTAFYGADAEEQSVTLQHGTDVYIFYGSEAFISACEKCESGDNILLSVGSFSASNVIIPENVTIIGCGYGSDYYNHKLNTTTLPSIVLNNDNIHIEGIYFSESVKIGNVHGCTIKKCWIESRLYASDLHYNTTVNQCVVKDDAAIDKGVDYYISHSTIGQFSTKNSSGSIARVENNMIYNFYINRFIYNEYNPNNSYYKHNEVPAAIYKFNILGVSDEHRDFISPINITFNEPSEFYNNLFFDTRPFYDRREDNIFKSSPMSNSYYKGEGNVYLMYYLNLNLTDAKYKYPYDINDFSESGRQYATAVGYGDYRIGPNAGNGFSQIPNRLFSKITANANYSQKEIVATVETENISTINDAPPVKITYWWNNCYDERCTEMIEEPQDTTLIKKNWIIPNEELKKNVFGKGCARLFVVACNEKGDFSNISFYDIKDIFPPKSTMHSLSDTIYNREIPLSWEGKDEWSGISYYKLYVKKNDESWSVIKNKDPRINFSDYTYNDLLQFYVVAVDSMGNMENKKTVEVTTRAIIIDKDSPITFTENGITYAITSKNSVCIWNGTYSGTIKVPSHASYNGATFMVDSISEDAFVNSPNLNGFVVDADNEKFISSEGVLYDKEMTTLLIYPANKMEVEFTLPASVKMIRDKAFANNKSIHNLFITGGIPEANNIFDDEYYSKIDLYVSPQYLEMYKRHLCWGRLNVHGLYNVTVQSEGNGSITLNNETLRNTTRSTEVKGDNSCQIYIQPDELYLLFSLLVNGKECHDLVVNNMYIIENVQNEINVSAKFVYDQTIPISTIEIVEGDNKKQIELKWAANKQYIEDYNIYYSENDQPFVLWLPNTTKETAIFKGQPGSTYRFTVTARDKAGNRERLDENKHVTVKFNAN